MKRSFQLQKVIKSNESVEIYKINSFRCRHWRNFVQYLLYKNYNEIF